MMKFLPEVIQAKYDSAYAITLRFNDGVEKSVDFSTWLHGPIFEPLKDRAYFKRFFLDGGSVCWPNGADIAPETLYAAPEYHLDTKQPSPGDTRAKRGKRSFSVGV